MGPDGQQIVSLEFEVFGEVQGRYFTKYCKEKCVELGIGGWVKNSKRGTIVGKLQGTKPNIEEISELACLPKKVNTCSEFDLGSVLRELTRLRAMANTRHFDFFTGEAGWISWVAWLSKTGSPGCVIDRCDLSKFEYLARQDFRGFSIRF